MIGLVTDSTSQLPDDLAARFRVEVVPLTITIDGVEYVDGDELGPDDFYARFAGGTPDVTTSQPSPARFTRAYRALAARGAGEILSVHIGSAFSGTFNAARLGARDSPVPVRVVDTATASFAVTLCLWEAADALAGGASVEEAAAAAERVGPSVGNVFVVGALDLARAGGRLAAADAEDAARATVPVLSLGRTGIQVVGEAADLEAAADAMAAHVRAAGLSLRVGLGHADAGSVALRDSVEARLAGVPEVRELVRYRIGPSVGAHTGPGSVGLMYHPSPPT